MPNSKNTLTRRSFLGKVATVSIASGLVGSPAAARPFFAPSDRITVGVIGYGKRARSLTRGFLGQAGVQLVAVSEVEPARRALGVKTIHDHYASKKGGGGYRGCAAGNDFREITGRDDIDAVIIATPDHWHVINAIEAARAGQDIYCEKPLTVAIAHGRRMVEEIRKHEVVFQTGSQQRSEFGGRFRQAVDYVRNGAIGKVLRVHVGVGDPAVPCDLPEEKCPEGTDWEMWNGPAPERGYHPDLCPVGNHNHFPAFRKYLEYAGGGLADMGAHHFDIAQWALNRDDGGPVQIIPPEKGEKRGLRYIYDDGVEMVHGGVGGCTFEGEKGKIIVTRGWIKSEPEGILKEALPENAPRVERSTHHIGNFLDCVRSRKKPICDAEVGHRSASICHLGNIGYQLGRPLKWDPRREVFPDDAEATRLVDRAVRAPWKV